MADLEKNTEKLMPAWASPLPLPTPLFAPRSGQSDGAPPAGTPAARFSARFSALNHNVRSIFNGSSIYSQSPALPWTNSPKTPSRGFMRRHQVPEPITIPEIEEPRSSNHSRAELRPPPTATSYIRAIAPLQNFRSPLPVQDRQPADVPVSFASVESESQQPQFAVPPRRHRQHHHHRRRRRRKHHRKTHWVRRKHQRSIWQGIVQSKAARSKLYGCVISGIILAAVLAIYLALALTRDTLRHEVHVLFIMVVVGLTLFFCHSLVRLFMLAVQPAEKTPVIPTIGTTENFRPVEPIRVHVVHDVELGSEPNDDWDDEDLHDDIDLEKKQHAVAPPPPVYGQWRGSVRADPNLLHWQRIEPQTQTPPYAMQHERNETAGPERNASVSVSESETAVEHPHAMDGNQQAVRPPSYISDDGVSYVVDGVPRSTTGESDIHPAWRSPAAYVRPAPVMRSPPMLSPPMLSPPMLSPAITVAPSAITEWPGPQRI